MKKDPWSSEYKSHLGNLGLGRAIAYYTTNCIPVMLPLNDTQKYDLVIDKDNKLQRVSVKITQHLNKAETNYIVRLCNSGESSGKSIIRRFDKTSCDIVFILTIEGTMYEIPSENIDASTELTLTDKWNNYIVTLN